MCSANGLQPDGQNDNGWDQGLLFLNPSQVWPQPPGYALQMFSQNYQPRLLKCALTGNSELDANAALSDDGKTLVVRVINPGDNAATAKLRFTGFVPKQPTARVTELSGNMEARNTAAHTTTVVPTQSEWKHGLPNEPAGYKFSAHSLTVLRFE